MLKGIWWNLFLVFFILCASCEKLFFRDSNFRVDIRNIILNPEKYRSTSFIIQGRVFARSASGVLLAVKDSTGWIWVSSESILERNLCLESGNSITFKGMLQFKPSVKKFFVVIEDILDCRGTSDHE